jgi:benzoate/toluate 1,2-dioxygenase alpha subunit
MGKYRENLEAIAALVQPDRVHRDVYLDPELFELEQESLFPRTWIYACHDSQLPNPGDYYSVEIAGRPLMVVRHTDRSIRVMMNRCAHKGAKLVPDRCGNTGKFFRCPYHAWTFKTDGSLLATPFKSGYEGTALKDCEAAKGLVTVPNVRNYRGFIFVRLSEQGPDFEEYFGGAISSIDYMVDRAPEGEVEVAGGSLRFVHDCNWKMFMENLNDTMHPMIVHESAAGTAKELWKDKPADEPKPMIIQQMLPFVNDYQFFDQGGVRVFENGHSYDGEKVSIHSHYSGIPEYDEALAKAHGKGRAEEILSTVRHNTALYPTFTSKCAIQAIRVARPIAVNKTLIESWTFRLKGAPEELLQRTQTYSRLINSPFSIVGHDDLFCYEAIQEGLMADGNEWVSLHRNFDPAELEARERLDNGCSEISMRNQFRAWAKFMTQDV